MLWHEIIQWVVDMLDSLISLLPEYTPPDFADSTDNTLLCVAKYWSGDVNYDSCGGILAYGSWVNAYVPLAESAVIATTLFAVWASVLTARAVLWIYDKLPFT